MLEGNAVTSDLDYGCIDQSIEENFPSVEASSHNPREPENLAYSSNITDTHDDNEIEMLKDSAEMSDIDYIPSNEQISSEDDYEVESQSDNNCKTGENHEENEHNKLNNGEELGLEEATGRKRKRLRCEKNSKRRKTNNNRQKRKSAQEYYGNTRIRYKKRKKRN